MLCGKRRIKPTRKYTSLGSTRIVHIDEGMCRQCAWEKIKLKCKICGEIIGKGFPRVLSHTAAHYTGSEILYNEGVEKNIIIINFESPNDVFGKDDYDYALRCKVCGQRFICKKEEIMFSKLINHVKSHYVDKELIKKEWIARQMVHLNYISVLQVNAFNSYTDNDVSSSSITYRELTKREVDAYRDALYRIRTEESITKSKGR
jgi:hypothetical protein